MKCFVGPQLSHCLGGADGTSGTVHGWLDLMPCRTSQLEKTAEASPFGNFSGGQTWQSWGAKGRVG